MGLVKPHRRFQTTIIADDSRAAEIIVFAYLVFTRFVYIVMSDTSSEVEELGIFDEPEGYFQPEKEPTCVTHKLLDGRELNLRLVGHNPLWVGDFSYFFPGSTALLVNLWWKRVCHYR